MKTPINRVGIIAKPKISTAVAVINQLTEWLAARQIEVVLDHDTAAFAAPNEKQVPKAALSRQCDLIVVLGGDGTLLSITRLMDVPGVPILAVNFGSLGFLTEITLGELFPTLESVINGTATTQKRMMIDATVIRDGTTFASYRALNDAAINKAALARIIDIDVRIDQHFVATYKADGLIVSTPTGSTGYTLAAGGPIVYPTLDAMLVTPIASHTLTFRSLVVPDEVTVQMCLKPTQESVFLTVDGQIGLALQGNDHIEVRKSAVTIELIESTSRSFFDILREKLKWGER